ncbi:hypothetical protein AgCh_000930 [Apium graveolens]
MYTRLSIVVSVVIQIPFFALNLSSSLMREMEVSDSLIIKIHNSFSAGVHFAAPISSLSTNEVKLTVGAEASRMGINGPWITKSYLEMILEREGVPRVNTPPPLSSRPVTRNEGGLIVASKPLRIPPNLVNPLDESMQPWTRSPTKSKMEPVLATWQLISSDHPGFVREQGSPCHCGDWIMYFSFVMNLDTIKQAKSSIMAGTGQHFDMYMVPRTSKGGALRYGRSFGKDSSTNYWQSIIDCLNTLLSILKENFVPPIIVQKIYTQIFSYINVQLFNSLLLRRECCTFSNDEYVKSGLEELEQWCCQAKEEYAGSAWDELKHIRQSVGFLYTRIHLHFCSVQ